MRFRVLILALAIVCIAVASLRSYSDSVAPGSSTPLTSLTKGLSEGGRSPVFSNASGVGTTNQIAKWADAAGTLGDSGIWAIGGLVGIGTGSPSSAAKLHVYSGQTADAIVGMGTDPSAGPAFNIGYSGGSYGRGSAFLNVRPDSLATAPNPSLRFLTANVHRVIITNVGRVGIATVTPQYLLDVNGHARVVGELIVDGNIAAKYQDLAEWVSSETTLTPGSVVIIHPEKVDEVRRSDRAYDTRVAGVVSPTPGIVLGEPGPGKYRIATVGRVRIKVDASIGAIQVGDLLVTSDVAGMAMKSRPVAISGVEFHRPGTIIGKALEPHASGTGEILALLSLQ